MKTRSPLFLAVSVFVTLAIAVPPDLLAQAQPAGQRAGEFSRLIPAVGIQRGAQMLTAAPKTAVLWQDLVSTQVNARARVALDDGSVLNIGSESTLRIVKHDAGAQQTELELTYGRLRSQAAKIAKPGGKFEVRTPAGVAGVVGTDFFLSFANGIMQLIVFEGVVRLCNLAGQCVNVGAGQMSTVRANENEPPSPPQNPTPQLLTDASLSTGVGKGSGHAPGPHHMSGWQILGISLLLAVPAIVVPLSTRGDTPTSITPPRCSPNNLKFCG